MKFHLISLGCPKNTVDSEKVAAALTQEGLIWTNEPVEADLVLLNTCGFIREAKEESLQHVFQLLELKNAYPNLRIVVFGCLVKRYKQHLQAEIPQIDHYFDFLDETSLKTLLRRLKLRQDIELIPANRHVEAKRRFLIPNHIGFLKIAEGCNNRCSYCAIPDIRGPYRPRPLDEVLQDVEFLVNTGAREICIMAQDTAAYGKALGEPKLLLELIQKVGEFPTVRWIRLHYLHPRHLDFEFLDSIFTLPKVLPYFDIPLQHVSDRILALMNRPVSKRQIINLYRHIRRNFKRAIIRTTFIVGFPGETEDDFQELIDFIDRYPIDRLGAFPYSAEEGTPAQKIRPKIRKSEKVRRLDLLMSAQQIHSFDNNRKKIGKIDEILIDKVDKTEIIGRTYGDSYDIDNSVHLPYYSKLAPGDFVKVRFVDADVYDLKGELIL